MGRIGAAHGIKGEVRIQSFTDEPLALVDYGPLATNRPGLVIEIEAARATTNVLVARLKGVRERSDAEKLNGVELYVDRDKLPPAEDDDFYHADLVGLDARLRDGSVIGQHRVVAADLFDETAVARRAGVGKHDVVVGALLGAGAGKADLERHSFSPCVISEFGLISEFGSRSISSSARNRRRALAGRGSGWCRQDRACPVRI